MCIELITKCKLCGVQEHYSWERCRDHREELFYACSMGIETPKPADCERVPEEMRQRVIRDMTVYECPVTDCKSTKMAKLLFEKRIKEQAEYEAKKKAKEDRFARRYFRKLPLHVYAPHIAWKRELERRAAETAKAAETAEGSSSANAAP